MTAAVHLAQTGPRNYGNKGKPGDHYHAMARPMEYLAVAGSNDLI